MFRIDYKERPRALPELTAYRDGLLLLVVQVKRERVDQLHDRLPGVWIDQYEIYDRCYRVATEVSLLGSDWVVWQERRTLYRFRDGRWHQSASTEPLLSELGDAIESPDELLQRFLNQLQDSPFVRNPKVH